MSVRFCVIVLFSQIRMGNEHPFEIVCYFRFDGVSLWQCIYFDWPGIWKCFILNKESVKAILYKTKSLCFCHIISLFKLNHILIVNGGKAMWRMLCGMNSITVLEFGSLKWMGTSLIALCRASIASNTTE